MFQPFELMTKEYVHRLLKTNHKYLVSQSYHRGANNYPEAYKTDILVTSYEDLKYAQIHQNAIRRDKYAAIIDLSKVEHLTKIEEMLQGQKYVVYWSVIRNSEVMLKQLHDLYGASLKHYISKNTSWRIHSGTTIRPNLELIFGELFLIIKYNTQTLRVKFDDIEKC